MNIVTFVVVFVNVKFSKDNYVISVVTVYGERITKVLTPSVMLDQCHLIRIWAILNNVSGLRCLLLIQKYLLLASTGNNV